MVKVYQLSVEVGRCWLPEGPSAMDLEYVLSVELSKPISMQLEIYQQPLRSKELKRESSVSVRDCL
jgi:hypothetical protein